MKCRTNNPTAFQVWDNVTAIKSNILQRWDSSPIGIRICCIKFVQRVVQVQTPGIIADPRVGLKDGSIVIFAANKCAETRAK